MICLVGNLSVSSRVWTEKTKLCLEPFSRTSFCALLSKWIEDRSSWMNCQIDTNLRFSWFAICGQLATLSGSDQSSFDEWQVKLRQVCPRLIIVFLFYLFIFSQTWIRSIQTSRRKMRCPAWLCFWMIPASSTFTRRSVAFATETNKEKICIFASEQKKIKMCLEWRLVGKKMWHSFLSFFFFACQIKTS